MDGVCVCGARHDYAQYIYTYTELNLKQSLDCCYLVHTLRLLMISKYDKI